MAHGLEDALAPVTALVAVAQLDCLVRTGRCARGYGGPPHRPRLQHHVDLDRRVPSRIEDLPAVDAGDSGRGHRSSSSRLSAPLEPAPSISETAWSKSSPISSSPICCPIFFAQRAMLLGSFSSTSERSLSLSRSSRLSSERTWAVREISRVRCRPPHCGQAGDASTDSKLLKKIDGRLPQSAQRYS